MKRFPLIFFVAQMFLLFTTFEYPLRHTKYGEFILSAQKAILFLNGNLLNRCITDKYPPHCNWAQCIHN